MKVMILGALFFVLLLVTGAIQLALILAGSHAMFNFNDDDFTVGFIISSILILGAVFHIFFIFANVQSAAGQFFRRLIYSVVTLDLCYVAIVKMQNIFTPFAIWAYCMNLVAIILGLYFVLMKRDITEKP